MYRCVRSFSLEVSSVQTITDRKMPGTATTKFSVSSGPIRQDNDHPNREGERERMKDDKHRNRCLFSSRWVDVIAAHMSIFFIPSEGDVLAAEREEKRREEKRREAKRNTHYLSLVLLSSFLHTPNNFDLSSSQRGVDRDLFCLGLGGFVNR